MANIFLSGITPSMAIHNADDASNIPKFSGFAIKYRNPVYGGLRMIRYWKSV
jgi:hypothetical protein